MSITRESYVQKIFTFIDKPVIKVISGMRRVGKSTIIKMLMSELNKRGSKGNDILYINKESLQWDFILDHNDLNNHVKSYFANNTSSNKYIIIDEVQEIKDWERAVNSFLSDEIADIIISGSNAHLLASDLATYLSGRYVEFMIYPLTFKEFLLFRGVSALTLEDHFKQYLRYGGMPGIHNFELSDEYVFQYINSIYNTVVLKDVISRNSVKDPAQLDLIIRFIFDNCGNITTAKRLSDYLKNQKISASLDKVLNYLKYLESAYLIKKVTRYDIKGLRHLELFEKYYANDIGLRHGLIGYRDNDIGGLIENIVYNELLVRGYNVCIGKIDEQEVDFIAERKSDKLYIQVSYNLSSSEVIDREFGVLEKIQDHYSKVVLTMDRFQTIERNGIKSVYIPDFLLNA